MDSYIGPKACKLFVHISLGVNIVVLIIVCTVLIAFSSSEPVIFTWGPPTAGRGILLSIYFSILVVSIILLGLYMHTNKSSDDKCNNKSNSNRNVIEHMVAALLLTQILYKITTPATAGPTNPVAISNLCISALHAVTLYLLWQTIRAAARIEDVDVGVDTAANATITVTNDSSLCNKPE